MLTAPFDATVAGCAPAIEAVRVRDGLVVGRRSDGLGTATATPTPGADRERDGVAASALRPPTPVERWNGDAVWRTPVSPIAAMATAGASVALPANPMKEIPIPAGPPAQRPTPTVGWAP
ncbi:MAG TPA: hypothetical protein VFU81_06450 [Thermomicrobiales bacterium]|nr:hypothetical protein [Thermomicrobiales bacterium]